MDIAKEKELFNQRMEEQKKKDLKVMNDLTKLTTNSLCKKYGVSQGNVSTGRTSADMINKLAEEMVEMAEKIIKEYKK